MDGFYWLIEGELAGCPCPGRFAFYEAGASLPAVPEPREVRLDRDLAWLREQGIGALLTLTEDPLPTHILAAHELSSLHIPVRDMRAPTARQIEEALGFIDRERAVGHAVAVHCLMGMGRTGTILAAYLIRAGAAPVEAIAQVRAVCPNAVCADVQELALHEFARQRDWIL